MAKVIHFCSTLTHLAKAKHPNINSQEFPDCEEMAKKILMSEHDVGIENMICESEHDR